MTRWLLVVEDEATLGEMICDNLSMQGYGTELVGDGEAALARLARGGVDLVILDIMLPKVDGFGVLAAMRDRGDTTPVLVLSARSADEDRIRGLELQADDYLTKPFNLRELGLRVGALLRRADPTPAGADTFEFGGHTIDFRAHLARTRDRTEHDLSETEIRLLRMFQSRDGEVIARRELLDHLFGPASLSSSRTLDNLVLNLRKLFERDGRRPEHLHTVRGVGFRFTKEPHHHEG